MLNSLEVQIRTVPGPIRVELGLYQGATLGGVACD
jgi:hypothetical protein